MQRIFLRPIGVVHSPVRDPSDMPHNGVRAAVEVFPQYAAGLEDIASNTHIFVVGWLHLARRDVLRVPGRHPLPSGEPRGVFGLRSSVRPNPIALCVTRLLRREGSVLEVDRLDMVDGTPVADLKRYSRGWDSVFSAISPWDSELTGPIVPEEVLEDLFLESVNFHGETCRGAAMAARMGLWAMREWRVPLRHADVMLTVGSDGCVADGMQAITGATLGNRRLRLPADTFALTHGQRRAEFHILDHGLRGAEEVLRADAASLFTVEESR